MKMTIYLSKQIDGYRNREALLDRDEDDTSKCAQTHEEIHLVHLPDVVCSRKIDQANDGSNYDCSKNNIGSVDEQWHEEQQGDHDRQRHDHIGHGGFAAGIVVHSRARECSWWKQKKASIFLAMAVCIFCAEGLHWVQENTEGCFSPEM